jgi:hypothetical protein
MRLQKVWFDVLHWWLRNECLKTDLNYAVKTVVLRKEWRGAVGPPSNMFPVFRLSVIGRLRCVIDDSVL